MEHTNVSHFAAGEWVDSVRGLLDPQRASEIRAHLAQKCSECLQARDFWTSVTEILGREPLFSPNPALLRIVESSLRQEKPWKWLKAVAKWAELTFDTARQPAFGLVRGPGLTDRHLVHEAAPFVIDVTIKTNAHENSLSFVGQILDSEHPDDDLQDVEVILLSGDDLIAKTAASETGEFMVECEPSSDLNLFITVRGGHAIGIPLSKVLGNNSYAT